MQKKLCCTTVCDSGLFSRKTLKVGTVRLETSAGIRTGTHNVNADATSEIIVKLRTCAYTRENKYILGMYTVVFW